MTVEVVSPTPHASSSQHCARVTATGGDLYVVGGAAVGGRARGFGGRARVFGGRARGFGGRARGFVRCVSG